VTTLTSGAIALAAHGWHVFPLRPRSKVPATAHGLLDATSDRARVEAWWRSTPEANVAVACGPSGLLVVDVDGEKASGAWADLAARHGGHDATLVSMTGRGMHVYFAAPAGAVWARSTASRIAANVDTRGAGGYVVAPPSVHETGHVYRWIARRLPAQPAAAPTWLVELLSPPAAAPLGERRPLPAGTWATEYGRAAIEGLVDEMLGQAEGGRNDRLIRLAFRAGRIVAAGDLDPVVAERALVNASTAVNLSTREAASVVRRGLEAGVEAGPVVRPGRQPWRRR
jgi:hypothetical protein